MKQIPAIHINQIAKALKHAAWRAKQENPLEKLKQVFRLATGVVVVASDRAYTVTQSGAWIRNSVKPWRGKSERRQVLKARRLAKANRS